VAFGLLIGLGLGPPDYHLLEVRGRTTGRTYATPVNLLAVVGRRFLVAPRGLTQWVRNAEVACEVALGRARQRQRFRLRPVPDGEKPKILKAYLDRFRVTVQRYFPVPAGSPAVFELLPAPLARREET